MSVPTDGIAWSAGQYVPVSEARIDILDWGFLHSDATYDVIHVWDNKFFRVDDHIARFRSNLEALRLDPGVTDVELKELMRNCVIRSGLSAAYVEVSCTRGRPQPGSRDPRTCQNQLHVFAIPFVWVANEAQRESGMHVWVGETQRIAPQAVNPMVKNYHWLDFTAALFESYDRGAESTILIDDSGNLAEGPGFNVFLVMDGALWTPRKGVLLGITRDTVMTLAQEDDMAVHVEDVKKPSLFHASEVFGTSTAGGIFPITRVNDLPIGDGKPGPITRLLTKKYWQAHERQLWAEAI